MATKNTLKIPRLVFIASLEKSLQLYKGLLLEFKSRSTAYDAAFKAWKEDYEDALAKWNAKTKFKSLAEIVKFAKNNPDLEIQVRSSSGMTDLQFVRPEPKKMTLKNPMTDSKFYHLGISENFYRSDVIARYERAIETISKNLILLKMATDTDLSMSAYPHLQEYLT